MMCDPICRFSDETTVFHAEFFNSFVCEPNVRTESQSDISQQRKKRNIPWQSCVFLFWMFCLGSGPVFCFASLFSLDGKTQTWPGDLRIVFWFWCFLLCLCDPICRFPDETSVFHAEFFSFVCLLNPNVRTRKSPRPDLRFAIKRKSAKQNKKRGQKKTPRTTYKICQVTQCPPCHLKLHHIKIFIYGPANIQNNASANCH